MREEVKQLLTVLLESMVECGKAGIINAIADRNTKEAEINSKIVVYGLKSLNQLENYNGYKELEYLPFIGWMFKCSATGGGKLQKCVKVMLDWYESVLNNEQEEKVKFDFDDATIDELVEFVHKQA